MRRQNCEPRSALEEIESMNLEGIAKMTPSRPRWRLAVAAIVVSLVAGCQQLTSQQPIPVPPAAQCTTQNLTPEALFTVARAGVAVVRHDGVTGSGFVVRHQNGSTLLVTNAHVVEGTDVVTVKWQDGTQDSAAVVSDAGGESPLNDLALLEVKALRGKVLNLRPTKPNVGAEVVAIGAPQGLEFSLSRGVVSSLRAGCQTQVRDPLQQNGSQVIGWAGSHESLGSSHQTNPSWHPMPGSMVS